MPDLRRDDIEDAEFVFTIYDCDGEQNKIDANDLGDVLRALGCNPTLAYIKKLGETEKRGEKIIPIEEFLQIFNEVKNQKDQGCYEDFIECLKLYDKREDGKMVLAELSYALLALGETLTQDQVDAVFADCMGEENDDGEVDYIPFLAKMCGKE
ncbi:myosin light chain alkali-like [Bradysia coprophila]|uniref:myosin light chain alkali-like n=1 Tax=Bradysia coprophila TaxID=38358 RepID=UPI00187DC8AB|nr:myosin light chain alkali-like [Bradysia coprophila]